MAVMKRIYCARSEMCGLQGVILIFIILTASAEPTQRGCDVIKKYIENRGFSSLGVLHNSQIGPVCGEGSCCSPSLEESMLRSSQSYIEKYIKEAVIRVSSLIEVRAKKFDESFRSMMDNSKREFHDMFERTYGKIYLQNAEVFSDFFNELDTYYKKGTIRLSETMDTFFGILYQRMFTVINSQYSFDDKYLECANEHMAEMKPFGDVPYKLSQQLRRSFVATRTFYKSLTKAAEAIKDVPTLRMDEECLRQLTQMQVCGDCKGQAGVPACSGYCVDIATLCLRHHIRLNDGWDEFVDAIEKVADRLIGPYNIESVVEPLNIKISEAIMNFQESGPEVTQKIQSKCGTPVLKRSRRRADFGDPPEDNLNLEIPFKTMKMNKKKHKKVHQVKDATPNLDQLIGEIKVKVKDTKQFWLQLPYQYCNNGTISAGPSENGKCWNGSTIGTYARQNFQFSPTEIPIISEQIYVLNGLSEKLRKAYQGMEVEIIDDTEESFDGSGSGSGDVIDEDTEEVHEGNVNFKVNIHKVSEEYPTPPAPTHPISTPDIVRTSSADRNSMSLFRALTQYFLPLLLVWFSDTIRELL